MVSRIFGLSLVLFGAGALFAQEPAEASPVPASTADSSAASGGVEEQEVSLKAIGPNMLHDQVRIWTFPAKVVTGHHVLPTVAVLGVTGGLIAADPTTGKFFRRHEDTFAGLSDHLTESVSTTGSLLTPAAFYLTGLVR